ncbi:PEX11E [Symbiodinium natans]|uniref:PEX11E protein n=1 Tax=Symbiodinium natans TaxID=878477 RepID=A0A812KJG4_9DINO|nr:PEX11E [Symbiodinium natans]
MAVSKVFFSTPPLLGHNESYFPPIQSMGHAGTLLAGPATMILVLGLQMLKKQLTSTHKSELYQHIWKFISKAEARDKTGRIVQYFCRFLQGFLGHMSETFWLQAWKPVIAEVQTTLAWARRTHRWGKELPHIPVLGQAIESGDILEAAQRAILITFLVQDHIYWLLKVGILKFQNYTAIQWHRRNLRFITLSHVLNFSLCVREISRIRAKQQDPKIAGDKEALKKADAAVYDNLRMMVRYSLTFIQMLHVSQVKKMDDWYIGLMGVASSYIDASKQW